MLPPRHRLHDPADFRAVVRGGRRQGGRRLVVHLLVPDPARGPAQAPPVTMGLTVSKAVGGAVVRNQVKRRLRHLCAERLPLVTAQAPGARLVLRALPPAAGASYAELGADLDRALQRLLPTGVSA